MPMSKPSTSKAPVQDGMEDVYNFHKELDQITDPNEVYDAIMSVKTSFWQSERDKAQAFIGYREKKYGFEVGQRNLPLLQRDMELMMDEITRNPKDVELLRVRTHKHKQKTGRPSHKTLLHIWLFFFATELLFPELAKNANPNRHGKVIRPQERKEKVPPLPEVPPVYESRDIPQRSYTTPPETSLSQARQPPRSNSADPSRSEKPFTPGPPPPPGWRPPNRQNDPPKKMGLFQAMTQVTKTAKAEHDTYQQGRREAKAQVQAQMQMQRSQTMPLDIPKRKDSFVPKPFKESKPSKDLKSNPNLPMEQVPEKQPERHKKKKAAAKGAFWLVKHAVW